MTIQPTKKIPLSATFLKQIKKSLNEEKKILEQELSKFTKKDPHVAGEYDVEYPEYGDEVGDNAREIADYTANKPLEETLEKSLRDVNKAIERLENGTYGTCKYCNQTIEEKRLLARPTSSSCVSCKKTLTDEI